MLVLSRKLNEEFFIGEGIEKICIKILSVHGMQVRVGIDAPKCIPIYRREIYQEPAKS